MTLLAIVLAILLDQLLGEPKRLHPLVGFGRLANTLEPLLRRAERTIRKYIVRADELPTDYRVAGALGWLLLVPVFTAILYWALLHRLEVLGAFWELLISALVVYFCIGGRSLAEHARAVARPLSKEPLSSNDIDDARNQLSRIVSRDTAALESEGIAKATVESVLENASDAILAPIFWFSIAGIPGVLLYRFANTLDAMWGYKNQHYRYFGWAAARMDDVLNWMPARCCALSYAITGNWKTAIRCWQRQAPLCESPNAGPVMASGAGAMGISLGGPACYEGLEVMRPELGEGRAARSEDIDAALKLVWRATILWLCIIAIVQLS
ncbi:MAG: cobalamin biosynthesis protein [Porticoccaceae bacterium]|nr:MAG: cobalamin biosynthesis protein [Porticoccaceae bacterium]